MCNNCIHKIVCSKYIATGGVNNCENHKEERRGKWVDRYGGKYANPLYECSKCKETIIPTTIYKIEVDLLGHEHIVQALTDYCPNCGADMRGTEDGQKERT